MISRTISCCVLFCALALAQSQTAKSQPSTTETDIASEAFVVQHHATKIDVSEDGSSIRSVEAEIKIAADAGVKAFAVLSFTYTSTNQVVDVEYVRVRKPDGTVIKTPDYNLQEMPAEITRTAPMYSDIREKHVAVKALGVGDTLEYKVRTRTLNSEISGQFWYEETLRKDQVIRDETLEVSLPSGKHVMVKSPDCKPQISDKDGSKVYLWKYSNLESRKEEESLNPKRGTPPPSIQISTFSSWEEIGRWYAELQQEKVAVTPAIQAKARELTSGLTTDDAKLRAIYNFVSTKIHYVGLDFGVGRYQPHSAEDVLGNEYGDCKDKHTLLAALLKASGFEAWPALIHSTQRFDPDVPSPAQFNHVISVVSRGGQLVWLDTTPEVAPYGLLMSVLRGKQALVVPAGKAPSLIVAPEDPPFPQKQEFTSTGKLSADGVLTGHIVQRFRGDSEVVFRLALRQLSQSQWNEGVQKLSYALGFGGEVSNVQVKGLGQLDEPLELSYDYLRKDYADWENKQILALLPPMGIEAFGGARLQKTPELPQYLGAKGDIIYHSEITLPPGSSLTSPADLNIVESYIEYHTRNVLENGVLKTTRHLVIKKEEVAEADWESLRKLAKATSNDTYNYIQLSGVEGAPASASDSEDLDRKFREAIDALQRRDLIRGREQFQQIIAANPKYPMAHYNLGVALATSGDMSGALLEFDKEEEVNPKEPRSYQAAARAAAFLRRSQDEIEEWRKLLKIDPKNRDGALRLSALLSSDGKFAEAVEVLEPAVEAAPDSPTLQFALGNAYAQSGQPEKALPHLNVAAEAAQKTQPLDYMQMNNIAYTFAVSGIELDRAKQYIDAALARLDELTGKPDDDWTRRLQLTNDYAYLWDTAGWIYYKSGDPKHAETYVRAAWLLRQVGEVGEHLAEIYEKLGRNKEAAHICELAIAARPDEAERKKLAARYQKLTGKPMNPNTITAGYHVSRLPNGEWPKTPSDELNEIRTASLGKDPGPDASAVFDIVFASDRPQSVNYRYGSEVMKQMTARLEHAKFQVEIPEGSHATLFRQLTVKCNKYAPCTAVLGPVDVPLSSSFQMTLHQR
jgi:tetratricopeptide (TPR) repeat protein